ncbi:MAG: hypothetical protein IJO93_01620 [Clostridia bacterium]|nr:hypothetical protein [Clostridia bacterium]
MYSSLLAYDEICRSVYREKQRIKAELETTETAKCCIKLKAELSSLVGKNKQLYAEVAKLNAEYVSCVEKYNECLSNLNMEVEDFEGRKDDTQIESNEFEECRRELEKLKTTSRKLEQTILRIAKRADEIATAVDINTEEGKRKHKQYKAALKEFEEEKAKRQEELDALEMRKKEAAKLITPELYNRYERILESHKDPLAFITSGRCSGCNTTLPLSMSNKINSGELQFCEHCGRMILKKDS